jgi:hypothetical protein
MKRISIARCNYASQKPQRFGQQANTKKIQVFDSAYTGQVV